MYLAPTVHNERTCAVLLTYSCVRISVLCCVSTLLLSCYEHFYAPRDKQHSAANTEHNTQTLCLNGALKL
jgi:hypothetical protein